jgi:hypothetical protein
LFPGNSTESRHALMRFSCFVAAVNSRNIHVIPF